MTTYRIEPAERGVTIAIEGIGDKRDELLATFDECAQGRCACPTDEYEKVEAMEVVPAEETISIRLVARPGTAFDAAQIEHCLDYTVERTSD